MSYQGRDLKKLVKNFRHTDLRMLMCCFKKNSKGKKSDLLERVIEMIDNYVLTNNSYTSSLALKIYEISNKLSIKSYSPTSVLITKPTSSKAKASLSFSKLKDKQGILKADKQGILKADKQGISKADKPYNLHYCPEVTFKSLPFYDYIAELMKPTAMKNSSTDTKMTQYAKYGFSLTPVQVKHIKESEVLTNDCFREYQQQVLLRFSLVEVTSEQDDNYPPSLMVRVNENVILLPSFNTPINAGIQPKRPNKPLDITFACVLNPINVNNIHLSWTADPVHNHCFSVTIAKRLNCEVLLKRLRQNCYRHPDHTRALVKEKLAASLDSEISFTCLKICLLCPLSKMKMGVPIRSNQCNHLQCFDASTFLQMNDKKPTWTCPICDKPSRYDSLIVDGLFLEILDKAPNATEIQFLEDGTWKEIAQKRMEAKNTLNSSVLCYEIVDSPESGASKDTIIVESKEDLQTSLTKAAPQPTSSQGVAEMIVVDLTGDSDEEEFASPSYETTVDSTDYLSSTSSTSAAPFDLSKNKKQKMNLGDNIFNRDLPFLDTPLSLFPLETYNDPPDLLPM